MIQFPPTPVCPSRTVSNFFENSRRYSQLKVDLRCRWHRWQMKKIFNQKNFNNFVGTPLDSRLKGIVSRDFRLLVFFMNQFPPSIWVYFYGHFEFFRNSRRYSRLKVHHRCQRNRWQMEKIFKQKNFNNYIWSPLGSRGNIYVIFFAFKFTLRCLQPDIVLIICHRHRWHRRQICRRYRWHRWQICHRCQQHKGNWWQNLPPVLLIPVAICHRCYWHRWCTLTCEYLREFSKNSKRS